MMNSIYSLVPPLIAIAMVMMTRKVLLSLGAGIVAGAILLVVDQANGISEVIVNSLGLIWQSFIEIFWVENGINSGNVYILLFLLLLGIITAFISITGGSRAFGEWAKKHVKSRSGGQLITAIIGILIFIDDYFNALAVGQIARPITDQKRISRAKLAYIIDSTSAPVCVISPISSWGASIIALLASILIDNGITQFTAFSAFIQMIPMNFYAWACLFLVFLVAWKDMNIGKMANHENRAIKTGEVHASGRNIPGELKEDLPVSKKGKVGDLIWPIIVLMVGTIFAMIWTGYAAVGSGMGILAILENTDVSLSLLLGGLFGLVFSILLFTRHLFTVQNINGKVFWQGVSEGIKSMLPAIYILILAWMIASLIVQLGTGNYLAGLVEKSNLNVSWLPLLLFVVAGVMAFSTGTSWGSFGILLPIAGTIASVAAVDLLLPSLAAVLAGAVFGDHCSPISDTTILSATGAGCNHTDHFLTQLPYAIIAAVCSAIGYLLLGVTDSVLIGLIFSIGLTIGVAFLVGKNTRKMLEE